ncbi:MAG: tetratricopeptide repeat protein [Vicinamibacterales bacterium]
MPIDREEAVRRADKLLRQGRLDAAIAEYEALAAEYRTDAGVANTLGDLYVRAGRVDRAVPEFVRIAQHFLREGFYAKASALCKKVLKLDADHDAARLCLAETAVAQGLVVEARQNFTILADRRRAAGDEPGADDIVVRVASLDSDNTTLQLEAARAAIRLGRVDEGTTLLRGVARRLEDVGDSGAASLWQSVLEYAPQDRDARLAVVRGAVRAGDWDAADRLLSDAPADGDSDLLGVALEAAMRLGAAERVAGLTARWLTLDEDAESRIVDIVCGEHGTALPMFGGLRVLVDRRVERGELRRAIELLESGLARHPGDADTLLRLLDLAIDANEADIAERAQQQLADAHLAAGRLVEARVIAQDLLARYPDVPENRDRLRRILEAAGEPDVDAVIEAQLELVASESADLDEPQARAPGSARIDDGAGASSTSSDVEAADAPVDAPALEALVSSPPLAATSEVSATAESTEPRDRVPDPPDEAAAYYVEIDLTKELERLVAAGRTAPSLSPSAGEAPAGQPRADAMRPDDGNGGGEDEAAHLQLALARAYVEAGQLDEASQVLVTAARDPSTADEAMLLMGEVCCVRNQWDAALNCFEHLAHGGSVAAGVRHRALYALGCRLTDRGDSVRALGVLLELLAETEDYLDARARVDELTRLQAGE